ncbi:hypothetical protein AX774_g6961, partial [Zancudomyces culisetae]
MATADPTP